MWDLSSPTRDQTWAPALEAQSLNHWTIREAPVIIIIIFSFFNLFLLVGGIIIF